MIPNSIPKTKTNNQTYIYKTSVYIVVLKTLYRTTEASISFGYNIETEQNKCQIETNV